MEDRPLLFEAMEDVPELAVRQGDRIFLRRTYASVWRPLTLHQFSLHHRSFRHRPRDDDGAPRLLEPPGLRVVR